MFLICFLKRLARSRARKFDYCTEKGLVCIVHKRYFNLYINAAHNYWWWNSSQIQTSYRYRGKVENLRISHISFVFWTVLKIVNYWHRNTYELKCQYRNAYKYSVWSWNSVFILIISHIIYQWKILTPKVAAV
jgi:hypothetical protein